MRNDFTKMLSAMFASSLSGGAAGEILNREVRVDGDDFVYQVYIPPAADGPLPLVTFLHGIRERGAGGYLNGMFATIARQYLKSVPALVLLPQCRPNRYWPDPLMDEMVMRQIEAVSEEFAVDRDRRSLLGVSMGGYGVWHFAARYPRKFAALVSICGGSPLAAGDRFKPIAERVGRTPAWLFHGAEDTIVQVSESRNLAAALEARGGVVRYSEYKGVGHNVWLNAFGEKELLPWLLAQKLERTAGE